MSSPFQLINPPTIPLCGQMCDNTTFEIQNVKCTKLDASTACANKFQIKSFPTIDSTGNTIQNITGSVIVKTATDNVTVNLPAGAPVGCILYVIHESGSYNCIVEGGLTTGIYVPVCSFRMFIKSPGGWAKHAIDTPP